MSVIGYPSSLHHQLLRGDVARRARLAGEQAAAQAADRGVEARHAEAQPLIGIGDAEAARVVQVQRDREVGPAPAHRAPRKWVLPSPCCRQARPT